jgi:hypothetical protein
MAPGGRSLGVKLAMAHSKPKSERLNANIPPG